MMRTRPCFVHNVSYAPMTFYVILLWVFGRRQQDLFRLEYDGTLTDNRSPNRSRKYLPNILFRVSTQWNNALF